MIWRLVFCVLGFTAAAVADEMRFDATNMEMCLVESDGAAEQQNCLGMAAVECIGEETQDIAHITACYRAEAQYWQRGYAEDSAYLIEKARTAPQDYGSSPGVGAAAVDVVANGAAYIDAVCGLNRLQWAPDVDPIYAENSVAYCEARMTGEHVLLIWQLLEQF